MARIVLIGDVGGCLAELTAAVGRHDTPDTTFVQVGDLVDRGPDSAGVLAFVAERLDQGRWVQLIGNHESQYLFGDVFTPAPLASASQEVLARWWAKERVRVAAAVRAADGAEYLVSHAGLTVTRWHELGAPVSAATTADLLNTRPEQMLRAYDGPLWAATGPQVYESWLGTPAPFGQIHGHDVLVDYERGVWRCGERIRARTQVNWHSRLSTTRIGGQTFMAIDPKHGETGAASWSPLVLEDATLVA